MLNSLNRHTSIRDSLRCHECQSFLNNGALYIKIKQSSKEAEIVCRACKGEEDVYRAPQIVEKSVEWMFNHGKEVLRNDSDLQMPSNIYDDLGVVKEGKRVKHVLKNWAACDEVRPEQELDVSIARTKDLLKRKAENLKQMELAFDEITNNNLENLSFEKYPILKKIWESNQQISPVKPSPIRHKVSVYQDRQSFTLLPTGLTDKEKEVVKKLVDTLGGNFVDNFSDSVTHVVVKGSKRNRAGRTLKYLTGIVKGCWIVNYRWIKASKKDNQWVPEEKYEVNGDMHCLGAPQKGRLDKNNCGLFHQMNFTLIGDFLSPNPPQRQLEALIQYGGGNIISMSNDGIPSDVFIISDSDLVNSRKQEIENRFGKRPISYLWLFHCVSHYEILHESQFTL